MAKRQKRGGSPGGRATFKKRVGRSLLLNFLGGREELLIIISARSEFLRFFFFLSRPWSPVKQKAARISR